MKHSIAIVVIAYNRDKSLARLLNSICNAYIDNGTTIIISIDKSNNPLVEEYANKFEWRYGEKKVVAHPKNLGLKQHILSCGSYLNDYDAVVVLEDDLVVARGFYQYAKMAVDKYCNNDSIAGISLYSHHINPHTGYPFFPYKNEYEAFFLQYAPSWGQVWMRQQWKDFASWLKNNSEDNFDLPHLPKNISRWGKQSWLKYHIKYAIENSKYFVYPYFAFSTTFSDVGAHTNLSSSYFQVVLQEGRIDDLRLPELDENAVKYDGNFERVFMLKGFDDLCIDLNGTKLNRTKNRFWLTSLSQPYKVINSYKLCYKPIENNIQDTNKGTDLFLYDTHIKGIKPYYPISTKWYLFDIRFVLLLLKDYGLHNIVRETWYEVKKKIKGK